MRRIERGIEHETVILKEAQTERFGHLFPLARSARRTILAQRMERHLPARGEAPVSHGERGDRAPPYLPGELLRCARLSDPATFASLALQGYFCISTLLEGTDGRSRRRAEL